MAINGGRQAGGDRARRQRKRKATKRKSQRAGGGREWILPAETWHFAHKGMSTAKTTAAGRSNCGERKDRRRMSMRWVCCWRAALGPLRSVPLLLLRGKGFAGLDGRYQRCFTSETDDWNFPDLSVTGRPAHPTISNCRECTSPSSMLQKATNTKAGSTLGEYLYGAPAMRNYTVGAEAHKVRGRERRDQHSVHGGSQPQEMHCDGLPRCRG